MSAEGAPNHVFAASAAAERADAAKPGRQIPARQAGRSAREARGERVRARPCSEAAHSAPSTGAAHRGWPPQRCIPRRICRLTSAFRRVAGAVRR